MKKSGRIAAVAAALALSAAALAEDIDVREELALEIIELTNADAVTEQLAGQMRSAMLRQVESRIRCEAMRPAVEEAVDDVTDAFAETMNSLDLRAQLVIVYAETFTEDELREIAAFYRSDAGRRLVEAMPEIMRRTMTLGQEHMQRMQARVQQAMARHRETFAQAAEQCEAPPG
jgi:hypothetical protein